MHLAYVYIARKLTETPSGGMLYDLVFNGGAIGMYCGSQQFTTRNLKFINTVTAIQVFLAFFISIKAITDYNSLFGTGGGHGNH